MTDAMLHRARKRVATVGWANVELVESSAGEYQFPPNLNGILSTFALALDPDYDKVIASGAKALKAGGRWVILDIKLPTNWLRHLTPLFVTLVRPFAVSEAIAARHPWESIAKHFTNTWMKELFFGIAYIAVGERPAESARPGRQSNASCA